jgi:hypothetical protein
MSNSYRPRTYYSPQRRCPESVVLLLTRTHDNVKWSLVKSLVPMKSQLLGIRQSHTLHSQCAASSLISACTFACIQPGHLNSFAWCRRADAVAVHNIHVKYALCCVARYDVGRPAFYAARNRNQRQDLEYMCCHYYLGSGEIVTRTRFSVKGN